MVVGLAWLFVLGAVRYELDPPSDLVGIIALAAAFVCIHMVARRPRAWRSGRLTAGASAPHDVLWAGGAAALMWFGAVAWYLSSQEGVVDEPASVGFGLVLAVGVMMPLVEEVTFRSWIQTYWEPRIGAVAAIVGTAVLFA